MTEIAGIETFRFHDLRHHFATRRNRRRRNRQDLGWAAHHLRFPGRTGDFASLPMTWQEYLRWHELWYMP